MRTGLIALHPVDDGGENLVRFCLQTTVVLNVLTNVTESLESGLLDHLCTGGAGHIADENLHQIGPEVVWKLHYSDALDTLGSSGGSVAFRAQSSDNVVLDVRPDFIGQS